MNLIIWVSVFAVKEVENMTHNEKKDHKQPARVFLSLGSNLGDKLLNLREAVHRLDSHEQIELLAVSSVYETDPVGYHNQPVFFNIAVCIKTNLQPLDLLHFCAKVEDHFERDRSLRWGPRTIDIDILMYNDLRMNVPELVIPHPEIDKRDFVKIPLAEITDGVIGCTKEVRPVYENWYERLTSDDE